MTTRLVRIILVPGVPAVGKLVPLPNEGNNKNSTEGAGVQIHSYRSDIQTLLLRSSLLVLKRRLSSRNVLSSHNVAPEFIENQPKKKHSCEDEYRR